MTFWGQPDWCFCRVKRSSSAAATSLPPQSRAAELSCENPPAPRTHMVPLRMRAETTTPRRSGSDTRQVRRQGAQAVGALEQLDGLAVIPVRLLDQPAGQALQAGEDLLLGPGAATGEDDLQAAGQVGPAAAQSLHGIHERGGRGNL